MNPLAYPQPQFRDAGESGLIVEFGDQLDEATNNAVIAFAAALDNLNIIGITETLPTIRSVMVKYDPLALPDETLRSQLAELIAAQDWMKAAPPDGRTLWHIPVGYGGEYGPDLSETAELLDISESEAIHGHQGVHQRVFMIGFAPGQAYLGQLSQMWDIPRRASITPHVPAGAVLVAVRQTVLYATPNPTGWRVIGRSPFRGFKPQSETPFLLSAGDEVVFEAVSEKEFLAGEKREARGECSARREVLT